MRDRPNPFTDPLSIENSNYAAFSGGRLVHPDGASRPTALTGFVHDALRALVLNDQFPCIGGKAAVRGGGYRFGLYGELGSPGAGAGLARDLFTFASEIDSLEAPFATFLASFAGPISPDEAAFEALLWRALQQLHDLDAPHHPWDPTVSDDPDDPAFSFSFCGTAFFVVGLHAASSRATRRFAWPTLVFNPHRQFEELRTSGRFPRFRDVIRRGDQALQGGINPMLADFGERSEASQYSGRPVGGEWRCPFHPHPLPAAAPAGPLEDIDRREGTTSD